MKKALRILLILAGILVLLVVAAVILAFQPSFQTWAARKAVASLPPGMEITIGRVAAGLNKTEVSGIHVKQPGLSLDLPSATIEVSLRDLLKNKVDIKNLVAKGWTVDMSQPAPAPAQKTTTPAPAPSPQPAAQQTKSEPFTGIFNLLKLPVDLTIATIDIDGAIILPPQEPGAQPARAKITLTGGGLAPNSDAKFNIAATATMPGPNAPVSNVALQASLTARMDTPRTFQTLALDADATATGAQFPQGARIRAQAAAQRGATGENYSLALKSAEKNLIALQATNPAAGKNLDATWAIDLRDADLAPFITGLGLKLPAFAANGQGTISADTAFQTIHAAGKLTADLSKLETLQPELATLGRVNLATNFDLVRDGDLVRVTTLNADISSNSTPIASIKTLQPIEANTTTATMKVPDLNADLVRVDLAALPLEWAQPFIKDTGLLVTGGPLRGTLTGRANDGGFSLRTLAPITLANLTIAQQQPKQPPRQLIQNLDLATNLAADYTPAGWNATITTLTLQSRGAQLLTLDAKAASPAPKPNQPPPPISATGKLRANLAALLSQPAAADFRLLSAGSADIDFTAKVAPDIQQVQAKLALANLQANDKDKTPVPNLSTDLRADLHANGEINLQAPLLFTLNSRKSDLDLTATLKPDGPRQNIDATIKANELYIEDLQKFAALAPATPATATAPAQTPAPPTAPATPDTKPAWDAFTGQVKLDIKKIVYTPEMQANNVTGSVKITPSLLTLENFRAATADGAEAKITGTVKFDNTPASAAQPYDTAAKLTVTNFDPAPILAAANPGKKPTVEGKFDIAGTVTGKSPTLPALASTAAADLTLTSRGGKFNGFATSAVGANLSAIQKLASTAAGSSVVGGLLSALGSKVGIDTTAIEKAKAASAMLGRLIEINFDQMNIDASYRPGKETLIKNFSILSPDMRLVSNGTIGNDSKLTWAKQAISLVAAMSVRGDQAADMRTLGLLKTEADQLGFTPLMESFPIQGTAASLTTDALIKQLATRVPGLSSLK